MDHDLESLDRRTRKELYMADRTLQQRDSAEVPRDATGCPFCGCTRLRPAGDRRRCDRCQALSSPNVR
jgi:hypothetical protein